MMESWRDGVTSIMMRSIHYRYNIYIAERYRDERRRQRLIVGDLEQLNPSPLRGWVLSCTTDENKV